MENLFLELNKFKHVVYYDEPHVYTIDDQPALISSTGLIGKFKDKFDKVYWSKRKSRDYGGVDPEEVIKMWDSINLLAVTKGSLLHDYAERRLQNKIFRDESHDKARELGTKELIDKYEIVKKHFENFKKDTQSYLIPIRSELVIGDSEWMIGGMVDQLFYNTRVDELQIWDWKTNRKLKFSNKFQNMKYPLHRLEDCEYNHYSLQLSLYKVMIEKNTNIRLGDSYVVWFSEDQPTYQIIKMQPYEDEVMRMIHEWSKTIII